MLKVKYKAEENFKKRKNIYKRKRSKLQEAKKYPRIRGL